MPFSAAAWEELAGRRSHPEPLVPADMNREQAWAWAMDNFEALSHHSCQHPQCCASGKPSTVTLLDGAALGAERGQKRCREAHVEESKAETAERLWAPQEVRSSSRTGAQWALKQSEDVSAHSGGDMHAYKEPWSPGRAQKLLKTEAYMRQEPGKQRHASLVASLHHDILQPTAWKEPGKQG